MINAVLLLPTPLPPSNHNIDFLLKCEYRFLHQLSVLLFSICIFFKCNSFIKLTLFFLFCRDILINTENLEMLGRVLMYLYSFVHILLTEVPNNLVEAVFNILNLSIMEALGFFLRNLFIIFFLFVSFY